MIIFLTALAGLPLPLTIAQLLWVNLITDSSLATVLTLERDDPEIMKQRPYPKDLTISNKTMIVKFAAQVVSQTCAVLLAYGIGLYAQAIQDLPAHLNSITNQLQNNWQTVDIGTAQSMAFITLFLSELIRVYSIRSGRYSLLKLGLFSILYMRYAVSICFVLLMFITIPILKPLFNIHPLSVVEWLIVVGLATLPGLTMKVLSFPISQSRKQE